MPANCCPTCGRKFPAAKPSPSQTILSDADVDTSRMSRAELYAHYKATAPLEDVRFTLKHARMSDGLRAGFEALELAILHTNPSRKAIYQEYGRLQDAWRAESNARERAERLQHTVDCPYRSAYNAPCECGRANLPQDAPIDTVTRYMVDRILAEYAPPARRLLCA